MRIVLIAGVSCLIFTCFQSCDYVEALYRDGSYIETEVWLEEFNSISVETPVQLILDQTTEQYTYISGLDFIVNDLTFTVENNTLFIESNGYTYSRIDQMAKVHLPVKVLDRITLNAPTHLHSMNELILDKFVLVINGKGTYSESNLQMHCQSFSIAAYGENSSTHHLLGSTEYLGMTMEGLAWTDASLMNASQVTINQRSLKSSYVKASDRLIVNMYSSGDVFFTGQPTLEYLTFDPGWDVDFGNAISQND